MFNTEVLGWKLNCQQNQKLYFESAEGVYSVLWPLPLWLSVQSLRTVNSFKGLSLNSLCGDIAWGFHMLRADVEGNDFMWIAKSKLNNLKWLRTKYCLVYWDDLMSAFLQVKAKAADTYSRISQPCEWSGRRRVADEKHFFS